MARTFYRHVIQIEILTEDPIQDLAAESLAAIEEEYTEGAWSGQASVVCTNEICDGPRMAKLLRAQGSDPEFFFLDEDGNEYERDLEGGGDVRAQH